MNPDTDSDFSEANEKKKIKRIDTRCAPTDTFHRLPKDPVRRKRKVGDICCFCGIKRWKAPRKHYYRFPTDPIRSDKWAVLSGKKTVIATSITDRYKRFKVCEDHFSDKKSFRSSKKLRLRPDAIPQALTSATPNIAAMKRKLQEALSIESVNVSEANQPLIPTGDMMSGHCDQRSDKGASNHLVCSSHLSDKDYFSANKSKLHRIAVPHSNLSSEPQITETLPSAIPERPQVSTAQYKNCAVEPIATKGTIISKKKDPILLGEIVMNNFSGQNASSNTNTLYLGHIAAVDSSDKNAKIFKICQFMKPPKTSNAKNCVKSKTTCHPDVNNGSVNGTEKSLSIQNTDGQKKFSDNSLDISGAAISNVISKVTSSTGNCNVSSQRNQISASSKYIINELLLANCNGSSNISPLKEIHSLRSLEEEENEFFRASIKCRIEALHDNSKHFRTKISNLRFELEDLQNNYRARSEVAEQFNIEALETGIETRNAKCLFLKDQLCAMMKEKTIWSESTLEFTKEMVKLFPALYDFLKQSDTVNLPCPKLIGYEPSQKIINISSDSE